MQFTPMTEDPPMGAWILLRARNSDVKFYAGKVVGGLNRLNGILVDGAGGIQEGYNFDGWVLIEEKS